MVVSLLSAATSPGFADFKHEVSVGAGFAQVLYVGILGRISAQSFVMVGFVTRESVFELRRSCAE
jgi:hypothetical protein